MAFSAEDLAQLGQFIESRAADVFGKLVEDMETRHTAAAEQNRAATVGIPDVPADAGPEFYVHLADGSVITSHDSTSTHMNVDGRTVQVIGRYQVGA